MTEDRHDTCSVDAKVTGRCQWSVLKPSRGLVHQSPSRRVDEPPGDWIVARNNILLSRTGDIARRLVIVFRSGRDNNVLYSRHICTSLSAVMQRELAKKVSSSSG